VAIILRPLQEINRNARLESMWQNGHKPSENDWENRVNTARIPASSVAF
jgi:hypothetical protein